MIPSWCLDLKRLHILTPCRKFGYNSIFYFLQITLVWTSQHVIFLSCFLSIFSYKPFKDNLSKSSFLETWACTFYFMSLKKVFEIFCGCRELQELRGDLILFSNKLWYLMLPWVGFVWQQAIQKHLLDTSSTSKIWNKSS